MLAFQGVVVVVRRDWSWRLLLQVAPCSSRKDVIIPEDEWIRMDDGLEGLEGGGATFNWERMLVSSGSLLSKFLVKVVYLVVTVVLVVKGSALEGPEGQCCRMERRAARVAALVLLRRDMKSVVRLEGGSLPVGVVCMLVWCTPRWIKNS